MHDSKLSWIWILIALASLCAAFVAIAHPSEFGFYTLTRWLVTAAAVVNAVLLMERSPGLAITSCILALVFNPIIPLKLGRDVWVILDLVAPVLLIVGGMMIMRSQGDVPHKEEGV